ncbi:hypothetical protein FS749_014588 [Ceratobasidium sp. UAMH 11750]|nr:hypothetical protein FS749_014588 [Ceratobasidium sp. UAMH 11750]
MSEDDPDLCLLPAGLDGWNFRTKSWDYFLVTHISPIEFNDDAFEHLVLQEKYKELVLAFVNAHTKKAQQNRPTISDVVKGKGGGIVMLLHGNPGTGKTLTAEAVADYLRRPLYSISSGELSLDASNLEDQLERTLKRAAGWDCVVLIDEADIFLQARNNDIQRSSLVSVFLRVLEYHNGVLILTTNRVDTFDKAFRSRIGVALKYPDLDQNARKILWTKFFTLAGIITTENATVWDNDIERLSLRVMNGRDIKNAVRGAQALAYQANIPVNLSHVEKLLSIADEFSESF